MKKPNSLMGGWFKKTILGADLWITFVLSAIICIVADENVLRCIRVDIGMAQLQIGTALMGVVLAGLAIIVVFLDERYIKILEQVAPGLEADLWPFNYVALLAVICASFGMSLILIGYPPITIYRIIVGLSLWSFAYLLWNFYYLVKFIFGHAKVRMKQIKAEADNK